MMAAPLTVLFLGDVNLGNAVNDGLRTLPPSHPWGDTLDLLRGADLRIANLECTLSDVGRRWLWPFKAYHHRSDERNVAVLASAGIDVAVLANNHTFDYGSRGLARTIRALRRHGIAWVGAGRNRAAAEAPAIRTVNGVRVGIVACMDDERWAAARPNRPGRFFSPARVGDRRAARVFDAVRTARPHADLLIASAHWGPNWGDEPTPEVRAFGRALVDAGADVVFGHSAHVLRGIEVYRGRPILYSAGDVVDDYTVRPDRNDRGGLFRLTWQAGAVRGLAVRPILIRERQANLAPPAEATAILDRMQRLCAALGTATVRAEGTDEVDVVWLEADAPPAPIPGLDTARPMGRRMVEAVRDYVLGR